MSQQQPTSSRDNLIELRGADSIEDATIEDIWIAGVPFGKLVHNLNVRTKQHDERLTALENNNIETPRLADIDTENQLPIQVWTIERRLGSSFEQQNKYRATIVWEEYHKRSIEEKKYRKLTSSQVKNILTDPDLPLGLTDPNPNTVKRVMEWVAKGTGEGEGSDPRDQDTNLVWLGKNNGSLVLIAAKNEWNDFFTKQEERDEIPVDGNGNGSRDDMIADDPNEQLGEAPDEQPDTNNTTVDADVDSEFDNLDHAQVVTSDDEDPVESSIEVDEEEVDITVS